jgi:uncharacterized cupredoxin-like copper-binding protein
MERQSLIPLVAVSLMLAACGGTEGPDASEAREDSPSASAVEDTSVSVTLTDYSVTADPATAPAGKVTFEVDVEAGIHALTVLRTELPPGQLPTRDDGAYVNTIDDRIEVIAWEAASDRKHTMDAELGPGAYVLICNLERHYTAGMWTGFKVA